MEKKDLNKRFYDFAYKFLINNTQEGINEKIVKSYLTVPEPEDNCKTISEVFYRMLVSAQNRQMLVNVIGGSIGGVKNLRKVLSNFDVHFVQKKYSNNSIKLLNDIEENLCLEGKIRKTEKSIWAQYCKTIISIANFLSQFSNYENFLNWINAFYNDKKSMAALPLIISEEIFGFKFALACDFLKELGLTNYGKPDVHVKEILIAYNFISAKASDYSVLKTMIEISKDANVSCYVFDKVLWLIGSGRFYNHQNFGKNGRIGKMKSDFIKLARDFINSNS